MQQIWILFALLSAVGIAIGNIITKRLLSRLEGWLILYARFLFAALFAMLLFFFTKIPKIKPDFYWAVFLASVINVIGWGMMIKAFSIRQLVKTFPLISFTPVFAILTGYIIVGEVPAISGVLGIVIIVVGSYILNFQSGEINFYKSLKRIVNEKSSRYMLGTAFLFSLTGPFFKKAVVNSSIWFTIATSVILSALILTLFFNFRKSKIFFKGRSKSIRFRVLFTLRRRDLGLLIITGTVMLLVGIAIFRAFELTLVAYAISVKRLSILFTIIFSYFLLEEKEDIGRILVAGTMMTLGTFLVALG